LSCWSARQDRHPTDDFGSYGSITPRELRMKSRILFAAVLALPLLAAPAQADWWNGVNGNDVGGIIPWSPDIAHTYRQIAAGHCARFDKVAVVTSAHKESGDYVGFRCYFPRGYDPRKGVFATTVRALD
jgi:hypothetical protein